MAAAGPEEELGSPGPMEPTGPSDLRAGVFTRDSLMQRALRSWEKFVRESIIKAADECCTEKPFEVYSAKRRTHAQNVAMQTQFAKIVIDVASEGGLDVLQTIVSDDNEVNVLRIQELSDVMFVERRMLRLTVTWE